MTQVFPAPPRPSCSGPQAWLASAYDKPLGVFWWQETPQQCRVPGLSTVPNWLLAFGSLVPTETELGFWEQCPL